jgi:hypothetical protein
VAALIFVGAIGIPLYLAALACLSINRFFLSGLGASLPHVVPRDELVMANAVSPTCGTVAALIGAGVGFGLRVVLGSSDAANAVVLLVAAVGYGSAAALAVRIHRQLLGPTESAPLNWRSFSSVGRDVLHDLADGARHVRERRRAARALAVIGAHRIGYGVMTIALALLCRNYFSNPADVNAGLSLLARAVTATGVGIAASALITPVAARRRGPSRWIGVCVGIAGLVQVVLVVHLDRVTLLLAAFALGLTGQGAKICVDAIVQDAVDDNFRGRVFSFYDVVFNAAFVSAAGLSVLLLPIRGYSRLVFGAIAILFAASAATYLIAERRHAIAGSAANATASSGADSGLDLEDEPALAAEIDPGPRCDQSGHPRFDRYGRRAG